MTQTLGGGVDDLRASMAGLVLGPADAGYDEARSIWNGDIDRRPAVVARCASVRDVATAVNFGRERGLEIAVRGGGHAYGGSSVCDDGLMIDLSPISAVTVDPRTRTARVGGGASLADLDAATQAHGLAVTGGLISHTGVGGLTLGGGMGWLARTAGLSIDNLVSAEVVLADGRVVRAGPDQHPDLFWALRGGGGNFGVVTEFEFRLHPIGPEVHLGLFFWGAEHGTEALRLARDYMAALPARAGALVAAGLTAPPAPFVPAEHHFTTGYALLVAGWTTAEEHARMVSPIREALPPLFEYVTPLPYTALQQMLDDSAPWGIRSYGRSLDLDELTDASIAAITEAVGRKTSPMSFIPIFFLDGAFCAVGEDETAFGGTRAPRWVVGIEGITDGAALVDAQRTWVRATWEALRPHAVNTGGYVNFMAEMDADRVRTAYGSAKYDRLARIKAEYDPANLFHRNANISPAGR